MASKSKVKLQTLYEHSVQAVANYYTCLKRDLRDLPETVLFDIYMNLYNQQKYCYVGVEFSDLDVFSKLLRITDSRVKLIKCFQAVQNHGITLAHDLVQSYTIKACYCQEKYAVSLKDSTIDSGIRLGGFLIDAGWFYESITVLTLCKELCLTLADNLPAWKKILECCHKLLHAETHYSQFSTASETKRLAEETIQKVMNSGENLCLAGIYTQFSIHAFFLSKYHESCKWSSLAVQQLTPHSCARVSVDALRQASKACVVKREFWLAEALICLAVYMAREAFGTNHPRYADALRDYGFYLLHSDSMKDSVTVYQKALKVKKAIYGDRNLHVAALKEDLAYALYVHEYSSGRFISASQHATQAIDTFSKLLPEGHLMLASAHRVKALILEEIALDQMSQFSESQSKLLSEAEKLHKNALKLCLASFGEDNVQTAKHYGNLGRLYQSMKKYEEAEQMHLKAIEIKERLLGTEDYEVGLSVGHLASLYNYHMGEYRKAEALYFRSIKISIKLFSETYSGLEYDYRGLVHVYNHLGESQSANDYKVTIERWKTLREEQENKERAPLEHQEPSYSLATIQETMRTMKLPPLLQ